MSKFIFGFAVFAILGFASVSRATPVTSKGWNELLNSESLFDGSINVRQSKSNDVTVLLDEFKSVLEEHKYNIYNKFKNQYNGRPAASFKGLEFQRLSVFVESLIHIAAHNAEARDGKHSYEIGVNSFTDMTSDELDAWSGYKSDPDYDLLPLANLTVGGAPDSLDYRTNNIVTPVKFQGNCGACQAFTSTAQLESVLALKNNAALVELSPQEMVDCAMEEEKTCKVGLTPVETSKYLQKKGCGSLKEYPYEAKDGACRNTTPRIGFVKTYGRVANNEEALKEALATYGPIAVGVGTGANMKAYKKGIFDKECNKNLTHGVTLVGYGSEGGLDYWIVKNSWGTDNWGEGGFGRFRRNTGGEGLCSIAKQSYWVTV